MLTFLLYSPKELSLFPGLTIYTVISNCHFRLPYEKGSTSFTFLPFPLVGTSFHHIKYLDLRQLQNLRENANVVGVCDEGVQPFAVRYGRGDGFKLVAT